MSWWVLIDQYVIEQIIDFLLRPIIYLIDFIRINYKSNEGFESIQNVLKEKVIST